MAEQIVETNRRLEGSVDRLGARTEVLSRDMAGLREDLASFRSRVETELRLGRWIAVFFAGVLSALVLGAGGVIWDAAKIDTKVAAQEKRLDGISADIKGQGDRLERMEVRLGAFETRFDKVDAKLDMVLSRLSERPAAGAPTPR